MNSLVNWSLENSRPMTSEESEALNNLYKENSTPTGRNLYDLGNEKEESISK